MTSTAPMLERLEALRYRRIVKADRHDPAQFDLLADITGHAIPEDYAAFLRRHPDFVLSATEVTLPHRDRTDGFFIATLDRA